MAQGQARQTATGGGALAGAVTGAVLGGAGRAALAFFHLSVGGKDALLAAATAGVMGALIGAVAGLTRRPLVGVLVGAGLTLLLYVITLPVLALFRLMGASTTPSVVGVLVVGAVSGGIGALVGARGRGAER
jgi:hypothetical protein